MARPGDRNVSVPASELSKPLAEDVLENCVAGGPDGGGRGSAWARAPTPKASNKGARGENESWVSRVSHSRDL